jgi:hypothetical protein
MIQIVRELHSSQADAIEAEFRELVLGYERVLSSPGGADAPGLPAIRDGERLVSGEAQIAEYLKELKRFVRDWRTFEGDYCYVDDDGDVC